MEETLGVKPHVGAIPSREQLQLGPMEPPPGAVSPALAGGWEPSCPQPSPGERPLASNVAALSEAAQFLLLFFPLAGHFSAENFKKSG